MFDIDMTFDDDTKLFGLMRRYSDSEEAEELKRQVIEYVRTQIHDVNAEIEQFKTASATAESASQAEGQIQFEDVSSHALRISLLISTFEGVFARITAYL